MKNYLADYETLSKIIDNLITQKFPNQSTKEIEALREESIKRLDNHISEDIFRKLTDEQLDELNDLLGQKDTNPDTFQDFFKKSNLNLEQTLTETIKNFSQDFLGDSHE